MATVEAARAMSGAWRADLRRLGQKVSRVTPAEPGQAVTASGYLAHGSTASVFDVSGSGRPDTLVVRNEGRGLPAVVVTRFDQQGRMAARFHTGPDGDDVIRGVETVDWSATSAASGLLRQVSDLLMDGEPDARLEADVTPSEGPGSHGAFLASFGWRSLTETNAASARRDRAGAWRVSFWGDRPGTRYQTVLRLTDGWR